MKTDIFEDMKERVGCENISDLPYRKRMVWEIIKKVFSLCIRCRLCCYNGNTGYDERK